MSLLFIRIQDALNDDFHVFRIDFFNLDVTVEKQSWGLLQLDTLTPFLPLLKELSRLPAGHTFFESLGIQSTSLMSTSRNERSRTPVTLSWWIVRKSTFFISLPLPMSLACSYMSKGVGSFPLITGKPTIVVSSLFPNSFSRIGKPSPSK